MQQTCALNGEEDKGYFEVFGGVCLKHCLSLACCLNTAKVTKSCKN